MNRKTAPTNFSQYPLLWLSVCFALGIGCGKWLSPALQPNTILLFTSAILAVIFIKRAVATAFLAIAFAALGAIAFTASQPKAMGNLKTAYENGQIISGEPLEVEGILTGKPELSINGYFLELKCNAVIFKGERIDLTGTVKFFAPLSDDVTRTEYSQLGLGYNSRVRIATNLKREDAFLNPGVTTRRELLDQQQIDAAGVIESPLLIEKFEDRKSFSTLAWVYEQRQNLIDEFRTRFSPSTAGIMIASLLGNKNFLDRQTAEIFREGGTFHVLVISGLHITFIGGLVLFFLRIFTKKPVWQFVAANTFLWAYTLAVGAEVPVVRAAVMFTILLLGRILYREGNLLNSLGACALVLLVWHPGDLFTPSFQLTFISVAAIVACAFPLIENLRAIGKWSPGAAAPFPARVPRWLKRFCETLYWRDEVWEIERKRDVWSANLFKSPYFRWMEARGVKGVAAYLFEGVLVSIIVQIWLLPLLVFYFNRVSFASVLLNIWVGFFLGLESFSAVIAVFCAQINETLALPLIKLTELLNWLLLSVPKIFVAAEWTGIRPALYSGKKGALYVLYFIPVIALALAANRWRPFAYGKGRDRSWWYPYAVKTAAVSLILLGALVIFHPLSAPAPHGTLQIDFLDVGQGDSTLITFPGGETLLIDAGGTSSIKTKLRTEDGEDVTFDPDTPRVGEMVVSRFLWHRGYSKVDYILATHADTDHIQGLVDIAKNFRVRAALVGATPMDDANYSELASVLNRRGVPIENVTRGDVMEIDGVRIEVLYPVNNEKADNNNSVVLRIVYGDKKFLLTGDIEAETEKALLVSPELLEADVIKVAHHGSRTSSTQEFVDVVKARYAIIPVGRRSRFGHPHEEVVDRWKKSGAQIMTTGAKGTITINTYGDNLEINSYLK